jgi:hypothetical protein
MDALETKIKELPETYRGVGKWTNALNEASNWSLLASLPALAYILKPFYNLSRSHPEGRHTISEHLFDAATTQSSKRFAISAGVITGISVLAGYFGYKTAENAEKDYGNAVSVVKDLTLENEKLKVDAKWAERVQERRQEAEKAPSKSI